MAEPFQSIHFNVADQSDADIEAAGSRPLARRSGPRPAAGSINDFTTEEAAARFYLSRVFQRDDRSTVRGLTRSDRAEVVPDLKLRDAKLSELTNTSIVRFVQTKGTIPVFGSRAVVELDRRRELLGIDAELADTGDVSPLAGVSPTEALQKIAVAAGLDDADALSRPGGGDATAREPTPPELTFFYDDDHERWHLAWYCRNVPAAPPGFFEGIRSHGVAHARAAGMLELDYLVDAHDGSLLRYWSSSPTIVRCGGDDEDGVPRVFFGEAAGNGKFLLSDPLRRIRTFDFAFKDIEKDPVPVDPVSHQQSTFTGFGSAVSAHYYAGKVMDFFKSVLKRNGIDDKGMELISYVNCTSLSDEPPPQWQNAAWWRDRMWYGQARDSSGKLRSFARHLDIIGHEIGHGVTQFTSNLVYNRQSGALNESFSDIFGVIIKNWDWSQPDTGGEVSGWDWEIGTGLGPGGLPLRDLKNPTRTGDPDHMDAYLKTNADNGGVHTNSNIHNKAAYNVLNARDDDGNLLFSPSDVAILYYLTLDRLNQVATFKQARTTLLNVTGTYLLGDPQRQQKLDAIAGAYDSVGIL